MLYFSTTLSKVSTIYDSKDIQNQSYLFVFCYKKDTYKKGSNAFKHKVDRIISTIDNLSKRKEYVLTDIQFAKAIADEPLWTALTKNNNPAEDICFMLFANGIIMEKNGADAYLFGDQGYVPLEGFIHEYLGDRIKEKIEEVKEDQRLAQQDNDNDSDTNTSINLYYPAYDPYAYWGSPWYYGRGWGYGNYHHGYGGGWRGHRSSGHRSGGHRGGGHRGGRHR